MTAQLEAPKLHKERSLVLLKPDAVQRALIGEITKRLEATGLKLTGLKLMVATREQVFAHYNKDDEWFERKGKNIVEELKQMGAPVEKEAIEYGRDIIEQMADFMTAGPLVAMVVEGNMATQVVVKMTGSTEPATADIGTIRGDLTIDSYGHAAYRSSGVRNLIHCSESPEEAEREIKIWFTDEEVIKYSTVWEKILYDVNLDGILE
ncbi:nucleoside-diphosphate kinase [Patescibacteria group bacterium]|jgi:nucleoside-diphosphate kinase|nr:nucleoside-diphosphate kinase [Patescibacteria group bacterium]